MAARQTRRRASGIGLGVDAAGGPVIDPTENVLALVDVQKQHQREKDEAEHRYQNDMRDAETRRINELAALRVYYDAIIEGMRTNSLKLLAEQLKENKADSSERTSKLEQFRWETGGKTGGMILLAGGALSLIMMGIALFALFNK